MYFVNIKEADNDEKIDNEHPKFICKVCGAVITLKGDMATHIALMNKDDLLQYLIE